MHYYTDAKHRPAAAMSGDAEGVGHATSGSRTDLLTRQHRMTIDEAHLILNVKRGGTLEAVMTVSAVFTLDFQRQINHFIVAAL
jgi:hypothetical protein